VATKHAQKPKDDEGSRKDAEADGNATDANANWILTVDVESLGRPEKQDRKEIGAGDESNDEREDQNPRILLQPAWEHGEFGELPFPDKECRDQCGPN